MPRYSIITPTVLRDSLVKTCASIDSQKCQDWEHIIVVDGIEGNIPIEIIHSQRKIIHCAQPHQNSGNTCRHIAYEYATGDYLYYLDDDNYLADNQVLEDLQVVRAPWALFPILKVNYGGPYFHCPPQRGFTDSGNFIVKREIGRWLNIPNYDADGILAETLKQRYPYEVLFLRPMMVYTR